MLNFKILPFLPFIALALVYFLNKFPKLEIIRTKISSLFAALFLIISLSLHGKRSSDLNVLDILSELKITFNFGAHQTFFCLILGAFWLFSAVYNARYFAILNDKKSAQFDILFLSTIGFLADIILSKNLISTAIFYQLLSFVIYFNFDLFATKNSAKSIKNFGMFLILSAMIMFLSAILTFAVTGSNQFSAQGIFDVNQINIWQFGYFFFFYALATISFIFLPFYFLFRNLYYLNPPALIAGLISFSLAVLVILYKVIFFIFDMKLFAHFMDQLNASNVLSVLVALNLIALIVFALRSENLKQILVLLFFNQLILAINSLILIGLNFKKAQVLIASFIFSQMLILFALGNISLYLKESHHKSLNGIFYHAKITVLSLIFAFLNLAGIIPAAGMIEKYWLLRDIVINQSWMMFFIVFGNIILLLICAAKVIYPMLEIRKEKSTIENYIEQDLSLVAPAVILPGTLFILLFPFVQRLVIN